MNVDVSESSKGGPGQMEAEAGAEGQDIVIFDNNSTSSSVPGIPSIPPHTRRPLPAGSDEIRHRDYFDDLVIEGARPPEYKDYSVHIPVKTFQRADVPTGCFSKRKNVESLLSTEEPTAWPSHTTPLLHSLDVHHLENLKYVAWRDGGVRSIQSPMRADVRWPLWVLDFWRDKDRIRKAKEVWRDALSYLGDEARKVERKVVWHEQRGEWGDTEKCKVRLLTFTSTIERIHNIGWRANVSTRTGIYDTLHLARLLGERWTTGTHLDVALVLLSRRVLTASLPYEARFEDSLFSLSILKHLQGDLSALPPRCKGLRLAAAWLKEGRDSGIQRRLYAIGHINNNHWIAIVIHSDGQVVYGDSLEEGAHPGGTDWWRQNGPAYTRFARLAGLRTDGSSQYPLQRMEIANQNSGGRRNSWDCGVCAVNALAHSAFGDELWTQATAPEHRVRMFLDALDMDAEPLADSDDFNENSGTDQSEEEVSDTESLLQEDVVMADAANHAKSSDEEGPLPGLGAAPPTAPPEIRTPKPPVPLTSKSPVQSFLNSFFTRAAPITPVQQGDASSKDSARENKRRTRDEANEGQIDPEEERLEDPRTRRSKWTGGPRIHVSLMEKAAVFQELLDSEVLKSFDDTGFVCCCTPSKAVKAADFSRQPLIAHTKTKKHTDWLKSRGSAWMLFARMSSTPIAMPHARPRAVIIEPTAAPCNTLSLSRAPDVNPHLISAEPLPPAACLGLHGKKYAALFTSLSDFGGLGANYHIQYGQEAFPWKAWDGRPKSQWETSNHNYPGLPETPSYGCRDPLVGRWTADEKRKYTREAKRAAVWYLERVPETVRSGACTLDMTGPRAHKEGVCLACSALLKNSTFWRARRARTKEVNRVAKLPEEDRQDIAYKKEHFTASFRVSNHKALLAKYQHLPAIAELSQTLEGESDERLAPFIKLQAFASRGWLKGKEIMTGLIECLVQKVEIEQSDDPVKAAHAARYSQDVMDWSILIRARGGTSAVQYTIARSQLAIPHPRTVKRATAKSGMGFALSGTDANRLKKYWEGIIARKLDHHPVVIMQDCTKTNPALTHTGNFSHLSPNGHIVGSILKLTDVAVIDETSPAKITAAVSEQKAIATQVRAVLVKVRSQVVCRNFCCDTESALLLVRMLQLPLDGDPGLVIHLSPTNGTTTSEEIFQLTDDIRRQLCALGAKVVASAADGAATELRAQDLAISTHEGDFVVYDYDKYDLHLKAPIYPDSGPEVPVQDAGHAKKTARNNLVGGATFLALGRCWAGFSNLLACFLSGLSGLISTDVLKTDKQDDAAARRVMLAPVLASCLDSEGKIVPEQRGIFGYLAIIGKLELTLLSSSLLLTRSEHLAAGEVFDAWFNRTMRIEERLKICFRGLHFLRNWKRDVLRLSKLYPGLYSTSRGFLSPGAFRILTRQCESLILLVISYRDFYPSTSFCPWQISSAPLEHWFGLVRQLDREFSIGGLFEMVKNVDLRHKILSSGRYEGKKERSGRRGYNHQVDTDPLTPEDLEAHRTFPTKATMDRIADEAWEEMSTISEWLGIPVPFLPLTPSAEPFVVFESDEADTARETEPDVEAAPPDKDEDPVGEELPDEEDEEEPEVPYEYPADPDARDPDASLFTAEDFGPAVAAATEEMIQRRKFHDMLEKDSEVLESEDAALDQLEPVETISSVLTSARPPADPLPRPRHALTPANSFAFSRLNKLLDVQTVIATRRLHVAGTNVQKERMKGRDSLLPSPQVLTAAGLIRPNVISNSLRVAQESTDWAPGISRIQSRYVRWTGTAKSIQAAALTQFDEALGLFSSQLLDTRGVSEATPLLAGSWMVCRNPGSTSHAPFWFIAENIASFTKTDKAGKYSHTEKIVLAETLAAMHVRAYIQVPSSGGVVDVEDDVFRHLIKRRAAPLGTPQGGSLPPGQDCLLPFVPGADFVYKFPGECFLAGDGSARELNPASAKLWKTLNSIVVGNAFVRALEEDDEQRAKKRKEKAVLATKAKSEALRLLNKDGKAGLRLMEKKRATAAKKAEKNATPKDEEKAAKTPAKKAKSTGNRKAAKASVIAKPAKNAEKAKQTWGWLGGAETGGSK
ncbi:hypothetical protein P7C70_g3018, partial [Phenoliferia sp. Uapishka_3]